MFIGSPYNLKNKVSGNPILINNKLVPRTNKYSCFGVNMDERLSWDKHIDSICSKVGAGIGAMRRVKPFVPLSTTKMLYNAIIQSFILIIVAPYGIIAELGSKIGCKNTKIVLQE